MFQPRRRKKTEVLEIPEEENTEENLAEEMKSCPVSSPEEECQSEESESRRRIETILGTLVSNSSFDLEELQLGTVNVSLRGWDEWGVGG